MDIFDAIEAWKPVTTYDRRDVPNELIDHILEAGTHASSAGGIQPWEFIVVKDKKMKKELSIAALMQRHVETAPVVIVVCANLEKAELKFKERGKNLYALQDTAAAIENMLLVAQALELGCAWVRAFEEDKVKSLLKMPDHLRPIAMITIGFPVSFEEYKKVTPIPYTSISWSEEYGKKLEWIKDYGRPSRYKFKTAYGYARQVGENVKDRRKEMKGKKKSAKKSFLGRLRDALRIRK